MDNISSIDELLKSVKTLAIAGHIDPDGDCVGSCLGLYNYVKDNYPNIDVDVYLEKLEREFLFINGSDLVKTEYDNKEHDLWVSLDVSDITRIGVIQEAYGVADNSLCIDHHISNLGIAKINHIKGEVSSCTEVLYELLDESKISIRAAEALYLGIISDTGVFKYRNTTGRTMQIAGKLMDMGVDFSTIIDEIYYTKSYKQNQALGRALMESMLCLGGKCIVSYMTRKTMDFYGVRSGELGRIVEQLRLTTGVECAIFAYEINHLEYKVSLRSKGAVNVNEVAKYFGGGGHLKAAGCTLKGTPHDVINNILREIEKQL